MFDKTVSEIYEKENFLIKLSFLFLNFRTFLCLYIDESESKFDSTSSVGLFGIPTIADLGQRSSPIPTTSTLPKQQQQQTQKSPSRKTFPGLDQICEEHYQDRN